MSNKKYTKLSEIDAEIKRLESEIETFDSGNRKEIDNELTHMKVLEDENGEVVGLTSALLSTDRITPLPKRYLPLPNQKNSLTVVTDISSIAEDIHTSGHSKKVSFGDIDCHTQTGKRARGMEQTVREMLENYEPSARRPFYCRICRIQASDMDGFLEHQRSDSHIYLMKCERKASKCHICRKTFTSPIQLREHLGSQPHKSRLAILKMNKNSLNDS